MRKINFFIIMLLSVCVLTTGCSAEEDTNKTMTPSKIVVYNEAKECIGETLLDDYNNEIKTTLIKENDGIIDDSSTEYEYDQSGNILKKVFQSKSKSYIEEHVYESGKIVKTSFQGEYAGSSRSYTEEFDYDQYGNVTNIKHTEDSVTTVTEYKYTYDGEKIIACETIADGETISNAEYTYDAKGNVIKSSISQSNGAVINIVEKEYDKFDNPTKEVTTMQVGSAEQVTEIEYENEYNKKSQLSNVTQYIITNGQKQYIAEYEYIYE